MEFGPIVTEDREKYVRLQSQEDRYEQMLGAQDAIVMEIQDGDSGEHKVPQNQPTEHKVMLNSRSYRNDTGDPQNQPTKQQGMLNTRHAEKTCCIWILNGKHNCGHSPEQQ